jgi:hypothetical protein
MLPQKQGKSYCKLLEQKKRHVMCLIEVTRWKLEICVNLYWKLGGLTGKMGQASTAQLWTLCILSRQGDSSTVVSLEPYIHRLKKNVCAVYFFFFQKSNLNLIIGIMTTAIFPVLCSFTPGLSPTRVLSDNNSEFYCQVHSLCFRTDLCFLAP